MTFHAEGGVILANLHPQLAKVNLSISSLGSISDQTLAGAISTSTHGTGVTYGSLSTFVTFLDIVLPLEDAPIVRVSREEDHDLFMSALCGLGVVGVIVGVGMRAEPNFKLEEECFSMRFDTYQKHWQEIAESAEHVRCWWFPQIGRVKISRLNRTQKVSLRSFNFDESPNSPSIARDLGYYRQTECYQDLDCRILLRQPFPRRRSLPLPNFPLDSPLSRSHYVESRPPTWSSPSD